LPKPRVEVSTKDAGEDGGLELVPEGILYTQHVSDSGKMERLPDPAGNWKAQGNFLKRARSEVRCGPWS
jgi:hypothetical protein